MYLATYKNCEYLAATMAEAVTGLVTALHDRNPAAEDIRVRHLQPGVLLVDGVVQPESRQWHVHSLRGKHYVRRFVGDGFDYVPSPVGGKWAPRDINQAQAYADRLNGKALT